ncbi:MAG: dTMP kinase [Burkholderiales bacterium]|nr:dTMP kinase [Burkholderiales bacterium]
MSKAKFITLEGIDGAGKSTQLSCIEACLKARGIAFLLTREPGGTQLGEKLRSILLHEHMHPETEALLMFAARAEHLSGVIMPALNEGTWVVSDRFTDASFAYQGGGRGLDYARLAALEQWLHEGFQPDLTLLFDVPVEVARERLKKNAALDRFEHEEEAFFNRVRDAYLDRAKRFPQRFRVIDSSLPLDSIKKKLEEIISTICL